MLHGGENLLDKVEALKARSAATKAELEVAARQQEEQQRRLEQLQVERLDLSAQYSTLEVGGRRGADAQSWPGQAKPCWSGSIHNGDTSCGTMGVQARQGLAAH